MVISSSSLVLLTVLGMGALVPRIDTATGSVTAVSDTEPKFTATGSLSYRDTDGDGNIDGPPFGLGGGNWKFYLQHLVKDWKIGGTARGADDFQLLIHGTHFHGPHTGPPDSTETDIDPNPLPAKTSLTNDIRFGKSRSVVAGGKSVHKTTRENHSDHYWVRSAIMPSPDPEGGEQHLTAGAFEIRAWHNKTNRTQKPRWHTMASTSAAGSTVTYDAAAGTLSFNIATVDILDSVGGSSDKIEPRYVGDPVQSSHWTTSDLQFLGKNPDGGFQFSQGNVELFDPDDTFNVMGRFSEFLIEDTTGTESSSGVGIFDATSISSIVDDFRGEPRIDVTDVAEPVADARDQPKNFFIDDFVDRNIFAVGVPDDKAALNQGLGFTFQTEQNLAQLTNGFSQSVFDIPATYIISAFFAELDDGGSPAGGLLGDFNNDGVVDTADYGTWKDNLGADSSLLGGNGSGAPTVVKADYGLWRAHFGESIASDLKTQPIPEPSTLLLALLGLRAVPIRMRRR
jgi:hypothetical protein